MKKLKGQYRQGDVLIERVSSVPNTATRKTHQGRIVLAEGETTGHCHAVEDRVGQWWQGDGQQYIETEQPVRHEEHGSINLAGSHKVIRQREYSPEAVRNVAD